MFGKRYGELILELEEAVSFEVPFTLREEPSGGGWAVAVVLVENLPSPVRARVVVGEQHTVWHDWKKEGDKIFLRLESGGMFRPAVMLSPSRYDRELVGS